MQTSDAHGKHRVTSSGAANMEHTQECLSRIEDGGRFRYDDSHQQVFGLVAFRPNSIITYMSQLPPHEVEQLTMWERILNKRLHQECFAFEITHVCPLQEAISVQQLSDRHWRGLVCEMEELQAPLLRGHLQTDAAGALPAWLPTDLPVIGVRLPPPHACLCVCSIWKSFVLPYCKRDGSGGSVAAAFSWSALGVHTRAIPKPPVPIIAQPGRDMTSRDLETAIAQLRDYGNSFDLKTRHGRERYSAVASTVEQMVTMVEMLEPMNFFQNVTISSQRLAVPEGARLRNVCYKVHFLLQVFSSVTCSRIVRTLPTSCNNVS